MDFGLGSLFTAGASIFDTWQNNQNAQQMQQQAEAYNTQMSNTAYQRASTDMKAAGLNPMMMAGGNMSASTPTVQPAMKTSNVAGAVQGGISSAVASATIDKLVAEVAKTKAETITETVKPDVLLTGARKTAAETATETQRPSLVQAETAKARAGAGLTDAEAATVRAALPITQHSALTAKNIDEGVNPTVRKVADILGFTGGKVSKAIEPITSMIGSAHGLSRFNQ